MSAVCGPHPSRLITPASLVQFWRLSTNRVSQLLCIQPRVGSIYTQERIEHCISAQLAPTGCFSYDYHVSKLLTLWQHYRVRSENLIDARLSVEGISGRPWSRGLQTSCLHKRTGEGGKMKQFTTIARVRTKGQTLRRSLAPLKRQLSSHSETMLYSEY